MRRRRPALTLLALTAAMLVTGCDTQPATDIKETSAVLNARGGCAGTESGTWRYQIRPIGGTFRNVGDGFAFACGGPTKQGSLNAVTARDLSPGTTYEFRILTTFPDGKTATFDSAGTTNGTAYDRFTTRSVTSMGGYAWRTETCGTNRGHGSTDAAGTMYAACGTRIVRFSEAGARLADITVGTLAFSAVAVSPDARFIYGSVEGRLIRLDRQANGSYARSTAWAPKPFALNNRTYLPVPRNLASDEFGNIYVSNAGTDPVTKAISPTRILKYAPDGSVLTHFGEHNDEPGNPYAFFQNRGLAATRDGRSLYVTSHLQGEVRRFDLQPDGSYAHAQTIGRADTSCASAGGLAAPSDVAVDAWGFVYVPDTSCRKIKKFTRDGALVAVIGTGDTVLHEIGVTRRGEVFAGEWNRFYSRTAANPTPGPIPAITRPVIDVTAPTLTQLAIPATTTTRTITVRLTATDDTGVAHMRFANEDGNWGDWRPYAATSTHQLSANPSIKGVYAQVRDAAGNESTHLYRTLLLTTG